MEYGNFGVLAKMLSIVGTRSWVALLALLLIPSSGAVAATAPQRPAIFFSDLDSGPNSGGETVSGFAGAYVTLYGNGFGASQGSSTVTWNGLNCLRVVGATGSYNGWGAPYLWYQKIVVQLGPACPAGSGNFVVTNSAGASNGLAFTVRSGNIHFVSTSGKDSNSGTFASPWATIAKGVNAQSAGDVVYIENGVQQIADNGYSAYLSMAGSGTSGSPRAIVAYPGATATIGQVSSSEGYGIRTPNIGGFHYWTIAGFIVRSPNIGIEVSGGSSFFRIIANDVSCPNAAGAFQGACIDSALTNDHIYLYGNYVHDNALISSKSSTSTKGFHDMYFSTDSNHMWLGWNYVNGDTGQNLCGGGPCNACRGIQFHSSPISAGSGNDQYDLHVHDNLVVNTRCDGINMATVDPSQGTVEVYNNVLYHVGLGVLSGGDSDYMCINFPGILNAGPQPSGTALVYNNTCYDAGSAKRSDYGCFTNGLTGTENVQWTNNICYQPSGQLYFGTLNQSSRSTGSNNVFFGNGSAPSFLTNNVNADPGFVSIAGRDFHLSSASSPANGAGATSPASTYDHDGLIRRSPPAIGAYEFASAASTGPKPNAPSTLTITVQ